MQKESIFYNNKFLVYGFGKSGYASYKFLIKNNNCKIIDDNKKNIPTKYKNHTVNFKHLKRNNFDYINKRQKDATNWWSCFRSI